MWMRSHPFEIFPFQLRDIIGVNVFDLWLPTRSIVTISEPWGNRWQSCDAFTKSFTDNLRSTLWDDTVPNVQRFEYTWVVSKLLTYRQRYLCFKFTTQALISMTEHDNQHTNWHKPFHHTSLVRNTLDHSFQCWDPTTCTTQMRFNSANINGQTSKRSINIVSLMRRFI